MAALLLRRLAGTHRGRVPLVAAACGGAALFYASNPPAVVRNYSSPPFRIPILFSPSLV
jgi:hypothetical protein